MAAILAGPACAAGADRVPDPTQDQRERIADLATLLAASAAGVPPPDGEMVSALESLCRFPPAPEASMALARALIEGLPGSRLDNGPSAEVLAGRLYAVMNGGYLRAPALARLFDAVDRELAAAGVSPHRRQAVTAGGLRVAREVRDPRRDWW